MGKENSNLTASWFQDVWNGACSQRRIHLIQLCVWGGDDTVYELSNEYRYERSIAWEGDDMGTIGFVSLRAFKWVPIWGVYCVKGWWYGYYWICLTESFQMSTKTRGLLCEGVMIWVPLDLSHWELSNEYQYEGSIVRVLVDRLYFIYREFLYCVSYMLRWWLWDRIREHVTMVWDTRHAYQSMYGCVPIITLHRRL